MSTSVINIARGVAGSSFVPLIRITQRWLLNSHDTLGVPYSLSFSDRDLAHRSQALDVRENRLIYVVSTPLGGNVHFLGFKKPPIWISLRQIEIGFTSDLLKLAYGSFGAAGFDSYQNRMNNIIIILNFITRLNTSQPNWVNGDFFVMIFLHQAVQSILSGRVKGIIFVFFLNYFYLLLFELLYDFRFYQRTFVMTVFQFQMVKYRIIHSHRPGSSSSQLRTIHNNCLNLIICTLICKTLLLLLPHHFTKNHSLVLNWNLFDLLYFVLENFHNQTFDFSALRQLLAEASMLKDNMRQYLLILNFHNRPLRN